MPDDQQIARQLAERFPGWTAWHGDASSRWWAMPPVGLQIPGLLSADDPDDLTAQILHAEHRHEPPAAQEITAGPRLSWRVDQEPWPVRATRHVTHDTLTDWGVSFWIDDALVIASELVTNSCRHAIAPVALSLALLPARPRPGLQIEVSDASTQLPTERDPSDGGGFGMTVLRKYADITIHPHPDGKTIRAVLPPTPTTACTDNLDP